MWRWSAAFLAAGYGLVWVLAVTSGGLAMGLYLALQFPLWLVAHRLLPLRELALASPILLALNLSAFGAAWWLLYRSTPLSQMVSERGALAFGLSATLLGVPALVVFWVMAVCRQTSC
jgi:hypothetical protein